MKSEMSELLQLLLIEGYYNVTSVSDKN